MNFCAAMASSRPASCRRSMQCGRRLSPMTKRGNFCFSTTSSRKPSRCNSAAAEEPAGPAPMISTSTSVCMGLFFGLEALLLGLFRWEWLGHALDVLVGGTIALKGLGNTADERVELGVITADDVLVSA